MALTKQWEFKITPMDVAAKTASIQATRRVFEEVSPDAIIDTQEYLLGPVTLATPEDKLAALDVIWQLHLDRIAEDVAVDAYLGGLETAAKANMEARENG